MLNLETTVAVPTQNLTWDEAIKTVLRKAGGALPYTEIAQRDC
jgi:hypothetical protein